MLASLPEPPLETRDLLAAGRAVGAPGTASEALAITPGKRPRFSKDFLAESGSIAAAFASYVSDVKARRFPGPDHIIA